MAAMLHCVCWNTFSVTLLMLCIFRIKGIKVIGHDTSVVNGGTATLLCHLTETDDSLSRILWKKKTQGNSEEKIFFVIRNDGTTEQPNGLNGDRVQFIGNFAEKNGSIQLLRMSLLDDGIYTCIFSLFSSGILATDINVTVFARPVVNVKGEEPVAGHFEATLASCFASYALPAAAVVWRLGDLENSVRTEINYTVHPNGTTTFVSHLLGVPFKYLNKKSVQCVVKHITLSEDFLLNYTINIHYPPESVDIIPDSPTNAKEFTCLGDGNPEPTNYTWTRVNKSTPYYEGQKLIFPKLSPDFNGLYICHASNQYGSSSGSLNVNVHIESSTVCWGLYGCLSIAVFGAIVGAVIIKTKLEWIPVSLLSNDDGAQEWRAFKLAAETDKCGPTLDVPNHQMCLCLNEE